MEQEDQGPGPDTEGRSSAEDRFWERYRGVVMKAGVKEGVAVWYRGLRRCLTGSRIGTG